MDWVYFSQHGECGGGKDEMVPPEQMWALRKVLVDADADRLQWVDLPEAHHMDAFEVRAGLLHSHSQLLLCFLPLLWLLHNLIPRHDEPFVMGDKIIYHEQSSSHLSCVRALPPPSPPLSGNKEGRSRVCATGCVGGTAGALT